MWGKFKDRVAAAGVMSAAAVQQFFNMNKLACTSAAPPLEVPSEQ
jgi:hypothetical protein